MNTDILIEPSADEYETYRKVRKFIGTRGRRKAVAAMTPKDRKAAGKRLMEGRIAKRKLKALDGAAQ